MNKSEILRKIESLEKDLQGKITVELTLQNDEVKKCELVEAINYCLFESQADDVKAYKIIGDTKGQGILPDLLRFLVGDTTL